jgi:5-methylthioadenosine/S-adenosylhomocysteine deaminase
VTLLSHGAGTLLIDSANNGGFLKDRDIVTMATRDAARILDWDGSLGSLEAGKAADFFVVRKTGADPYSLLLEATERDVDLVVINGYARYGNTGMVTALHGPGEAVTIAGVQREFFLKQSTANPTVAGLSYADAQATLDDVLIHFGSIAPKIIQDLRKPVPLELQPRVARHDEDLWELAPKELEQMGIRGTHGAQRQVHTMTGALAISGTEKYELDAVSVVDDPKWTDRLSSQINLPPYMKEALAAS